MYSLYLHDLEQLGYMCVCMIAGNGMQDLMLIRQILHFWAVVLLCDTFSTKEVSIFSFGVI